MTIQRSVIAARTLAAGLLVSLSACGDDVAKTPSAPSLAPIAGAASMASPAAPATTGAAPAAAVPPSSPASQRGGAAPVAAVPPASATPASVPSDRGNAPGAAPEATPSESAGTAATPAVGGFPRDEPVNVEQKGPYAFDKYSEGLDNPTYASSILYYPTDAPPPYAVVLFSPAYTVTQAQYEEYLGPLLASHGIAILLTTPTSTSDSPALRAADLQAAMLQVQGENTREGSPLKGKVATDRICVTGHSMGGGGSLWAATELGNKIKCALPTQPWQPGQSFEKVVVPTMFIAGELDNVAGVATNARLFFDSIPETVPKYYVEFANGSHYLTTNTRGEHYDVQSRYMLAFYKMFLEDDKRYAEFLAAEADPVLSSYEFSKQ